ncbi:MAG: hypothetical protein ACREAE_02785 [Nitrosopumilaceae archaeon]
MIGKIIIIGVIAIAAIFLIPGISNVVPLFSSLNVTNEDKIIDSNRDTAVSDVTDLQNEIQPLELDQVDPKYVNKQVYTGQVFEKSDGKCKVSVPELAETINGKKEITHVLEIEDCTHEVNEPVEVTKLEAKDDIPMPIISTNSITVNSYSKPAYFDVIQLTSTHKGSDVLISYNDSSGNTIGVVVTLRNSEKEIFSGQFTSSKFEALVNDVPNTPHMIEMTVEHSVYGTLHASVYAPADSQDSTISGIFTES